MIKRKYALEQLLDHLSKGVVHIDEQRNIKTLNQKAKEITGVVYECVSEHEAGVIKEGDIVILADNNMGGDDGELCVEDLTHLNIVDKHIKQGDMILGVGVYHNKKIQPVYKYMRDYKSRIPFSLETTYLGFSLEGIVDVLEQVIVIRVNGVAYSLDYFDSIGHMVVIDANTGRVKFFQAKGYGIRKEDIGFLLRGNGFLGKVHSSEQEEFNVVGKSFQEVFYGRELTQHLNEILEGKKDQVENIFYEINKRWILCSIYPGEKSAYLILEDASKLERLLDDRNQMIEKLERKHAKKRSMERIFPKELFRQFVGSGFLANEVKYLAYKASQTKFNIIITGESGTGKSMLAREIHNIQNPNAPFVEVNCAAITPSLMESELFGYVGGAFTGAAAGGKVGFFERANGGTIFLDEIGELPLEMQVKLLYVFQNKTIYRVGSSKPIFVDMRVIVATNKNLQIEVEQGRFRQDLYYRIYVFPIEIPPLRDRKEDLYILINCILQETYKRYDTAPKILSGEALGKMLSYYWPGNVRELENIIERSVTLCDSHIIYPEHICLPQKEEPETLKLLMEQAECHILQTCFLQCNGDKQKVMEKLQLSKTVFYEKIKKYNIIRK